MGYEDDPNLYAYVRNDPLNLSDPNGREAVGYLVRNDPHFRANSGDGRPANLDDAQAALGAAGFAPGVGAVPDLLNTGISLLRGDFEGAGWNAIAIVPFLGDAAKGARLAERAREIHSTLDPIAARMRTTAVVETAEGSRFVASSEDVLSRGQQAALQPGENAATGAGHAEITAADAAQAAGETPVAVGASRPICDECRRELARRGIR